MAACGGKVDLPLALYGSLAFKGTGFAGAVGTFYTIDEIFVSAIARSQGPAAGTAQTMFARLQTMAQPDPIVEHKTGAFPQAFFR